MCDSVTEAEVDPVRDDVVVTDMEPLSDALSDEDAPWVMDSDKDRLWTDVSVPVFDDVMHDVAPTPLCIPTGHAVQDDEFAELL